MRARTALTFLCLALPAWDADLKLETSSDIESLMFPADESRTNESLQSVFLIERAGTLVTTALKFGPAYASAVAGKIPDVAFKQSYRELAKYLDMFGPCQKSQARDAEGWWSAYPQSKSDQRCSEVIKLLAANLLWAQVHYCEQLVIGDAEPKAGGPFGPRPWHLDQPPVKTVWLKSEALYALTDSAVHLEFRKELAMHCESEPLSVQADCRDAVTALSKPEVDRDLAALALARVMVRHYESVHLRHLEHLEKSPAN